MVIRVLLITTITIPIWYSTLFFLGFLIGLFGLTNLAEYDTFIYVAWWFICLYVMMKLTKTEFF